jgi:hypothetical protein
VSSINYILNKKKKDPINRTWKEERHDKGKQKNHFWQEQQIQCSEADDKILSKDGGLCDTWESIDFQKYGHEGCNEQETITVSSKRSQRPPVTRKDDFLWISSYRI